jgi:diacylglycerol O-acyltransferase
LHPTSGKCRTGIRITKTHHSVIDGESGLKRIYAGLSPTDEHTLRPPGFAIVLPAPAAHPPTPFITKITDSVRAAVSQAGALNQVSVNALRKVLAGIAGAHLTGSLPFAAHHAPTNEPLKIGRTFATLTLPLDEMHDVGRQFGATLNDVAATVVDAGLHAYLRDTDRAFAHPFIAMCPVSLRSADDSAIGTRVSALFVRLGQPEALPVDRIRQIMHSIAEAKRELARMSSDAALTYAVGLVALAGLSSSTHLDRITHPACNLVISNVAGVKEPRYLNGALLVGIYPVSALAASIGLNVTLTSYQGSMDFGFVANAAVIDDLPKLADHTLRAYRELAKAARRQPVSS